MIKISALSKSYGNHQVLNGIDACFRKGEINGIVGDNGAGKTTLFKCIAGLESFEGQIEYTEGKGTILKNELGFLPTDPYFLSRITGKEYLQLLCHARRLKTDNIRDSNIFDLPLDEYAENYSTGMQKKLALTGLLLQKNEVFILDEPFNGVDIHSNIIIREILARLKQLNKTVIMSSHIFSTLSDSCDYLHHLSAGSIRQTVGKDEFAKLEDEMKGEAIGTKIDSILF